MRIEFPRAVYHVTSRGDRREPIFVDDEDRRSMLAVGEQAMARFDAQALGYGRADFWGQVSPSHLLVDTGDVCRAIQKFRFWSYV